MTTLYLDIETCPSMAWVWSTGKQYIAHGQILEDTRIICVAYKWEGKREKAEVLTWDSKQCDKRMLTKLSKIVEKADVIVAHNGMGFDVKHINARMAYHSLPPLSLFTIEDTLKLSRRTFKLASHSLAYLLKYFKVGAKMKTGGIDLWLDVWLHKCPKALAKMARYCRNDVTTLEPLHVRIKPYVPGKINKAISAEDKTLCPGCGGKLMKRGIRQLASLKKMQTYQCYKCGKYSQTGVNLVSDTKNYPR